MGKHKHKNKSKKSKKHKKSKYDSPNSLSDSSNDDNEIVWAESTASKPEEEIDEKHPEKEETSTNEENMDMFDFLFNQANDKNKKNSIQQKNKDQNQAKESKIRYARELNSYFRDDVNKKFVDDPDELRKLHSSKEVSKLDNVKEEPEYEDQKTNISDAEMNNLNAKIIKAEMLGNVELAEELKEKLKQLKNQKTESCSVKYVNKSKPNEKNSEDKMSVKEMYLKTKSITSREEAMRFVASSSKIKAADDEYEDIRYKKKAKFDLVGFDRINFRSTNDDDQQKCHWCLENIAKHLVLKFSFELNHCFVSLTPYKPFVPNICQIISRNHSERCSLEADQDCWREIRQTMRTLAGFFEYSYKCTTIFMETHFKNKKRHQNISGKHFVIECIPVKKRYETDAKIFFHKAILELGEEWSINRKLIKLEKNPITRKLPKGLAYFWVSVGPEFDGYGHVIEDEDYFDRNFAKDVILGLYDDNDDDTVGLMESKRKMAKNEHSNQQIDRIKDFKSNWKKFVNF